jgi:hypothetical protein
LRAANFGGFKPWLAVAYAQTFTATSRFKLGVAGTVKAVSLHVSRTLTNPANFPRRWLVTSRQGTTPENRDLVLKSVEFGEVFLPAEAVAFRLFRTSCL